MKRPGPGGCKRASRRAAPAAFTVTALGLALLTSCGGDRKPAKFDTVRTVDGVEYLPHEVILKRQPGVTDEQLKTALSGVGGTIADSSGPLGDLGYVRVTLSGRVTADQAIPRLQDAGVVTAAERNYVVQVWGTPNDPRLPELWGMAKIGAPAAWNVSTGSASVLVAVSDTGIDYTHPDLAANMWTNPGEIPRNGVDDDRNGYVDDVHGFDFANNDADPRDDHGHGTHVAGTIGGVGNDGKGIVGVNWNVRIMGVKFLTSSGSGSLWNGAQTILYAARNKAKVVNASWGCQGASCYASYLEEAIRTLANAGGLFVAAAGNSGSNNDDSPAYPANYNVPNVISVAASDPIDGLAYFSNFGSTKVHIAAPGVQILSSTPGGGYATWNGTSMAAPHVAGAAALLFAARPSADYLAIKEALLKTGDKVALLTGRVSTGARLSAAKLMTWDDSPPASPTGVVVTAGNRNDVSVSWEANREDDLAAYRVRWGTTPGSPTNAQDVGPTITGLRLPDLTHGTTYHFVVHALDRGGNVSVASAGASVTALDRTAPAQVIDLALEAEQGQEASGRIADASGEASDYFAAVAAIDGNPDTAWMAPPRAQPQEEYLIQALTFPFFLDRVELLPSAAYPAFFPVDFDVELSTDGTTWTTVGGLRGATTRAGQLVTILFPPTWASFVRLHVVRSFQHSSGLWYTGVAELTAREASEAADGLRLSFTAPGDDPGEGRAVRYDVRTSSSPIDESSFAAATSIAGPSPPGAAGLPEAVMLKGLRGDSTYFVALKAVDEAGNASVLSNVASAVTGAIPPSTITDLRVVATDPQSVTLAWTAPGGDGKEGQASSYDVRVSELPITAGNFSAAQSVPTSVAPGPSGVTDTITVGSLQNDKRYHFAVRAIDVANTPSAISNVVTAEPDHGPDATAPATVGDLVVYPAPTSRKLAPSVDSVSGVMGPAFAGARLVDGDVEGAWMAPGATRTTPAWAIFDVGTTELVNTLRMHPTLQGQVGAFPQDFELQGSVDKVSWETLLSVKGFLATPGQWSAWGIPPTATRYVRLMVTRRGPAGSDNAAGVSIGEIELHALTPQFDVDLSWVAPGDDGYRGTAVRYDLRSSNAALTEANFAAGTSVTVGPPRQGGSLEVLHLAGLPLEATVHFAIKAVDDAGNVGALSNVVHMVGPAIAPAPVSDLVATAADAHAIRLAWTATGDDGLLGTATSYDLRYGKTPLNSANFESATRWTTGPPAASGQREAITVNGLDANTSYYFAVRAIDDMGGKSLLSNVARTDTLDGIAPAGVKDLVAVPVDATEMQPLAITVVESTGAYSPETGAERMLDANVGTLWMTPNRAASSTSDSVRFDLGGSKNLARVRMRAATGYVDLFPIDFRVEVQAGATGAWTTVINETGFASAGGWEEWSLGALPATQARLVVTKAKVWAGSPRAGVADFELYEDAGTQGRLRLTWTAPGDDSDRGTAVAYDLRRADRVIDAASFAGATAVPVPAPRSAGSLERAELGGLTPETTYCFALQALDDVGLTGGLSNSPCATTPGLAPSTIVDLSVVDVRATTVSLAWTAPGADGKEGRASAYEMRMAPTRISAANWSDATPVVGLPSPAVSGSAETFTVTGLKGLTRYHFALRAIDAVGLAGGASNNAVATTLDDVAPAKISDLSAKPDGAQGGAVVLTFTAPGDNGPIGTAKAYDVRVSASSIDEGNFASATPMTVGAPRAGGSGETFSLTGLGAESAYFFAVKTVDAAGNVSAMSNVATGRTREEAPGGITDLAVVGGRGTLADSSLTLAWTASGDDATSGQATRYELRWSTAAITASNFAAAKLATGIPTPGVAGTSERFTLSGLAPGQSYWIAIVAFDDRGNASQLSNVVKGTTPDEVGPSRVTDLAGQTAATSGSVTLSWTAPGDDGATGRAARYELRWSQAAIDESNFAAATTVTAPATAVAGTRQTASVNGLPVEAEIHFALRAIDDAGTAGAVSNDALVRTRDLSPSGLVLKQTGRTSTSVTVGWTAPGDDGSIGTAAAYELRWSATPFTTATFEAAAAVSLAAPQPVGTAESTTITGLASTSIYYVAARARDERNNWSPLSNILIVDTTDDVAPSRIIDLVARTGASPGAVSLTWTAPGDDGVAGRARAYELRRSPNAIDAATWATATVVAGVPAPKAAGGAESFTVTALDGETLYHFALRALDDVPLAGPASNDASASTPAVPPSAVADLKAVAAPSSVTLTWTAPGDDGTRGRATSYDVRFAKHVITAAGFAQEPTLLAPVPQTAGAKESMAVSGLSESTTYYFAVKTKDDAGAWSDLSNVAQATTPDVTKPGQPGALAVVAPNVGGTSVFMAGATASSTLGPSWTPGNALDSKDLTSWGSAGALTPEWLLLDLGVATDVDRVRLLPDGFFPKLFPRDFVIETSEDKNVWISVANETAFGTQTPSWLTWGFGTRKARYVRLTATAMNTSYSKSYALLGEAEVLTAAPADGRAQLTWVATGDDGAVGTAASYRVWRGSTAFSEGTLGTATAVAGAPKPLGAGALQSFTVQGLAGETTYHWAVQSVDEAGNVGPLSAVVSAKTNAVAPAPVQDLVAVAKGQTAVDLTWTAPGDDARTGTATSYELRHAGFAISSQNFALATKFDAVPAPAVAGTKQTVSVTGLKAGSTNRFALIARDEDGNASYLSNVAVAVTVRGPDVVGPEAVVDLVARQPAAGGQIVPGIVAGRTSEQAPGFTAAALIDGNRGTVWASAARASSGEESVRVDLGGLESLDRVRLWPSESLAALFPPAFEVRVSPDGLGWTTVVARNAHTAQPGQAFEASFARVDARYVELRAIQLAAYNGQFFAVVAELEALTASEPAGTVVLAFSAPADDGVSGSASSYDLRIGACPFQAASSGSVPTVAAAVPGAPERARAINQPSGRRCAMVVSIDAAGNRSASSNVAEVVLP